MRKLSLGERKLDLQVPRPSPYSVFVLVTIILLRIIKLPSFLESGMNYHSKALSFSQAASSNEMHLVLGIQTDLELKIRLLLFY